VHFRCHRTSLVERSFGKNFIPLCEGWETNPISCEGELPRASVDLDVGLIIKIQFQLVLCLPLGTLSTKMK